MDSNILKIIALIVAIQIIGMDSRKSHKKEDKKEVRSEDVYLGWPHTIEWPRKSQNRNRSITILNTSDTLYNETINGRLMEGFHLATVTEDTATEYVITYTDKKTKLVKTEEVKLHIIPFPKETCHQTLEHDIYTTFESSIDSEKVMDCEDRSGLGLGMYVLRINQTCTWYRNCTELTDKDYDNIKRDSSCEIRFPSVQKDQYGVYTCTMNYNGMQRATIHYNLCYKPTRTLNKSPILCPTEPFKAKIGEHKTILVKSILGTGEHNAMDMGVTWRRLPAANYTDWRCWNYKPEGIEYATHDDTFDETEDICQVNDITEGKPKCTMDVASIKPEESYQSVIRANFTIKKVKKSDFGIYELSATVAWTLDEQICNITLVEDTDEPRTILLFTLLGMSIVLIVIAIAYCMRRSLRILYRRHFAKIEDSCQIYLSYQYSSTMDEETKEITKRAVTYVEGILTKLGCSVFDENRDGNISTYESENVHIVLESCQLIFIILLSPHFISDGWTVFKLQKCFERSVVAKSKLVFIITPKMIKYVKEKSSDDDFCSLVKNAMKMNHVVVLPYKFEKSNTLPFEIELAVPRLRTAKKNFKEEALVYETQHL